MTKNFSVTAIVVSIIVIALASVGIAKANPFYTGTKASSATATTTVSFLTPGTGTTTTPIYDSYEVNGTNQKNSGNVTLPDTVAVLLQGAASSTASTLTIACEFSDDGVDWYQNEIFPASSTLAIAAPVTSVFTYASSSAAVGGVALGADRFSKLITCPVPLRYVRTVITNTGANASVWRSIVPTKQRN